MVGKKYWVPKAWLFLKMLSTQLDRYITHQNVKLSEVRYGCASTASILSYPKHLNLINLLDRVLTNATQRSRDCIV